MKLNIKIIWFVFIIIATLIYSCSYRTINSGIYLGQTRHSINKSVFDTLYVNGGHVNIYFSYGLNSGWRNGVITEKSIIYYSDIPMAEEMDSILNINGEYENSDTLHIVKISNRKVILENNKVFVKLVP